MRLSRTERSAVISEKRKSQILEAAMKVFSDKGFSQASTVEIARIARVSQGTIFYHYPTKYDLLMALVSRYFSSEAIDHTLKNLPDGNVSEKLKYFINERLNMGFKNIDTMLLVISEIQRDQELFSQYVTHVIQPIVETVEKILSSFRMESGQSNPDIPVLARLLIASIIGLTMLYKIEGEEGLLRKTAIEEIAGTLTKVILNAVGTGKEQ